MGSNSFAAQSSSDRLQQTLRLLSNRVTALESSVGGTYVESITGISPVVVNNTDPQNPVISHGPLYDDWVEVFNGNINTFLDGNIGNFYSKSIGDVSVGSFLMDAAIVGFSNVGSKDGNITVSFGTTTLGEAGISLPTTNSNELLGTCLAPAPQNFSTTGILPYGNLADTVTVTLRTILGNLEDYASDTGIFKVLVKIVVLP